MRIDSFGHPKTLHLPPTLHHVFSLYLDGVGRCEGSLGIALGRCLQMDRVPNFQGSPRGHAWAGWDSKPLLSPKPAHAARAGGRVTASKATPPTLDEAHSPIQAVGSMCVEEGGGYIEYCSKKVKVPTAPVQSQFGRSVLGVHYWYGGGSLKVHL